jgi:hypothetical protein
LIRVLQQLGDVIPGDTLPDPAKLDQESFESLLNSRDPAPDEQKRRCENKPPRTEPDVSSPAS